MYCIKPRPVAGALGISRLFSVGAYDKPSVFDGVAKAVDYQLARILGPDKFFRFQTRPDKASDDLDNATPSNIAALRAEAQEILTAQKDDIQKVCEKVV
jgi:hypothetical protein